MSARARSGAVAIAIASTIAIASAIDCSNASSTTTAPCKDPPTVGDFSQPCVDCETQNCAAEWTTLQSACAGLIACEGACECDNATCLANCDTPANATDACKVAGDQLGACAQTLCVAQCESGMVTDAATLDLGGAD